MVEVSADKPTKASIIRTYLLTGGFRTVEIAALVKTDPRTVRRVRQNMSGTKTKRNVLQSLHWQGERIAALEARLERLERVLASRD